MIGYARTNDPETAKIAAAATAAQEGSKHTLRPNTHKHVTLQVFADSTGQPLSAEEAGRRATPEFHLREGIMAGGRGGTRRTYDLRALDLVTRVGGGFVITAAGQDVLRQLNAGEVVCV